MDNRFLNLTYRIGTFRSAAQMHIPDDITEENPTAYVKQFNLEDRVDMLCVTEFLMLKNERLDTINQEAQVVRITNGVLRSKLREVLFSRTLQDLGLVTSIDFLRFGKKLCWPTPSDEFDIN